MHDSNKLQYDYSTKNFHRFGRTIPVGAINEVYIPRALMPQPVAEVTVVADWTGQALVLEKIKPPKARG